jgi:hypothetical protein
MHVVFSPYEFRFSTEYRHIADVRNNGETGESREGFRRSESSRNRRSVVNGKAAANDEQCRRYDGISSRHKGDQGSRPIRRPQPPKSQQSTTSMGIIETRRIAELRRARNDRYGRNKYPQKI